MSEQKFPPIENGATPFSQAMLRVEQLERQLSEKDVKIESLRARVVELEEALKFYSEPARILSGSDYQMYATSNSRWAYDDNGKLAREALSKTTGDNV